LATSAPDEFPIISRIRSYFSLLKTTKEEVEQTKILGSGENRFKNFASKLIDDLLIELQEHITLIEEIEELDAKSTLSENIHRSLEAFLNWVDLILRHCNAVGIEMHQFVSYILRDLDVNDMDYLLLSGPELSEASLSEGLSKLFIGLFQRAYDRIANEFPSFCILFIPQSLLKNPVNWPLCVHEIGHMIENQKLKIVENFYPRPEFGPVSTRIMYNTQALKYWYSKEFQADYFATAYFGPIFPNQLIDNYFTKEVFILPTHPSWEERIKVIVEALRTMELEQSAETLLNKSRSISPTLPMIPKGSFEHLDEILLQTRRLLEIKRSIYKTDEKNLKNSREALTEFIPYTDDVKALLNVAGEVKKNLLENAKSQQEKERIEENFDSLIEDSIRLSYLKRIFAS
jgi:hypothetical protein